MKLIGFYFSKFPEHLILENICVGCFSHIYLSNNKSEYNSIKKRQVNHSNILLSLTNVIMTLVKVTHYHIVIHQPNRHVLVLNQL